MTQRILVVDDDENTRSLFDGLLRDKPCETEFACNATEARRRFKDRDYNLILMDQRLPDGNGLDLLREWRAQRPQLMAILITGYADVRDAVRAVRDGLFDYLTKPFDDLDDLEAIINRGLELDRAYREIDALRESMLEENPAPVIVGQSAESETLITKIKQVAPLDVTILIEGESGTGKELVAKTVHARSSRASGPFMEVNCGALSESLLESTLFGFEKGAFTGAAKTTPGYLESADGGTLFLDEITDMSPKLQASLLSVLQERKFLRLGSTKPRDSDFRLIGATNKNLLEEVRTGNFREDLYYRINVVNLTIAPLRDRPDDIIPLAIHFLELFASKYGKPFNTFTPDALALLERYVWPGNVRHLKHAIERVVALHSDGPIDASDFEEIDDDEPYNDTDDEAAVHSYQRERAKFEREYLSRLIEKAGGNMSEAARMSGISRQNLYVRLKKWDMS